MNQGSGRPARRKKVSTAFTLTGMTTAAAITLAGGVPAAEAGTNGQHVYVVDEIQSASYVQVCGHNQNNTWVCTSVAWEGTSPRAFYFPTFWFKGWVNVWGWKSPYYPGKPGNFGTRSDCYVSPSNTTSNWSTCILPR